MNSTIEMSQMECGGRFLSTRYQRIFQEAIELLGNSKTQCGLWLGCASTHLRKNVDHSALWLRRRFGGQLHTCRIFLTFLRHTDLVLTLYHCGKKDIDSSCTNDEIEDEKCDTSHNDQDSDVSFDIVNDEEIDAAEIEEEEWVEYIKRSTIEAMEKMENEKIRCWTLTQRKIKWRLAMRIATSQKERWLIKAAEWNPELSSKYRTNRSIGRPRKRWEDDINEFLKQIEDETENMTESSNHINKNWINTAKDCGRWTLLEENYIKNSVTRTRRNSHNRPARCVNGVKLSDEAIADIT